MVDAPRPHHAPDAPVRMTNPSAPTHSAALERSPAERAEAAAIATPPTDNGERTSYAPPSAPPSQEKAPLPIKTGSPTVTHPNSNQIYMHPSYLSPINATGQTEQTTPTSMTNSADNNPKPTATTKESDRTPAEEPLPNDRSKIQDQGPDLVDAKPWDKVPERQVQRMLDNLKPGEKIEVVLDNAVLEKVKEGPTRARQPELAIYGTKEGDEKNPPSWYAGLKEKSTDGADVAVATETDINLSPKVTLRREPLDVTPELVKEIKDQTGATGVRAASIAGDVEHIVLQVSKLEPPFDPTKFDSEHAFANGKVADIKQTSEDGGPNLVGEIKPTGEKSVRGGIFQGARQAYDAALETGRPHDSYVLMYGRIPPASNQENKDKAA